MLGAKKYVSSMKILAELGRTPLKINTELQMFKYLSQFAFIEKDRYVFKAFQEENHAIGGWAEHIKTNWIFRVRKFYGKCIPGDKWGNLKRKMLVKTKCFPEMSK